MHSRFRYHRQLSLRSFAVCCSSFDVGAVERATLLHCGRLVDVRAGRVLTNMTIVVDGPAIARVEQGLRRAAPATPSSICARTPACPD